MIYKLTRPVSVLNTSVKLPASKSISNRLLIINALSGSKGLPEGLSDSDDTDVMVRALHHSSNEAARMTGELHSTSGNANEVAGGRPSTISGDANKKAGSSANNLKVHDIGHAGTSMRFLTAFFSSRPGEVLLTGSQRMKERPIGPLVNALRTLGAEISYTEKEGFPPLMISGRELEGGEIAIDGGVSSQFISALLMVAPTMKRGLRLELTGEIVSASYIAMTLALMKECGVESLWSGNHIAIPRGKYRHGKYRVEADWSAASYWYAMGLLEKGGRVELAGLKEESLQGDSALTEIFGRLGMQTVFDGERVVLVRGPDLEKGVEPGPVFEYDFTNCPDIVQSMAVVLCLKEIPFMFSGTQTLKIKETDRIVALQTEMRKLGYVLEADGAGAWLSWDRKMCTPDSDPVIATYHDHRMAMAFAPAALIRGRILIEDPEVVTKSYPGFWKDLERAGFTISLFN
jgi:3-phosphoshikimate 1-carboxyvinyltransferase